MKNISKFSFDNISIFIDYGRVPILVSLLNSPKDDIREQVGVVSWFYDNYTISIKQVVR